MKQISLVEVRVSNIKQYLNAILPIKNSFIINDWIFHFTPIGELSNNLYANEFEKYIYQREYQDDGEKYNFTDLLTIEQLEELEDYCRYYETLSVIRFIMVFDEGLEFVGILNMDEITKTFWNRFDGAFVDISKILGNERED